MRCPSCETENPDHASFCVHCGVAIFAGEQKPHLGHYRLESKLGEGGMGVVYRAIDEKLHREVAIKVLHPYLLQHENLKERFRREARMHAKIMHPHIVTLLSLYEDGDHMALVMEMIHGKNLKEYLSDHPHIDLSEIVRISEAILSGLDAAHRQGMVHRDLKPANVMLANNGGIKLMDFGLAKPQQGDDDLTQSGATVGSFRYMAPEQIMNQAIDARTDLYAFGILLYQITTGRLPFDATAGGGGEFEIMEKQVRHDPVPPKEINSRIPAGLSDLIMRLLAKNKESRPEDCGTVQRRLVEILQHAERSRSHAMQASSYPSLQAKQTSGQIAKGLIRAWSRQWLRTLIRTMHTLRRWLWEKPAALGKTAMGSERMRMLHHLQPSIRGLGRWAWSGIVVGVLLLGWMLFSVIHRAERPGPPSATHTLADASKQASPQVKSAPANTAPKPAVKPVLLPALREPSVFPPTPEPAVEPPSTPQAAIPSMPKPKPPSRPNPAPRSVTYRVAYKVVNSQSDRINPDRANEFRGGHRLYFASLKDNRTDKYRAYQKGWVRLFFEQPVRLSSIHIRRISTTKGNFKGGLIELAVQDGRGHWTVLLRRHNRDIDTPIVVRGRASTMAQVKGVRLRFRSPEPLIVGPINLLP